MLKLNLFNNELYNSALKLYKFVFLYAWLINKKYKIFYQS